MISEKFIICILRFLACFPFCELYGGCIIVDIFQTLFTKNTKHCVSNTSGEIISLASTLNFNLNIHKKLVFYYRIINNCNISPTPANSFSSNNEIQLFFPMESIKCSACSARYFSNAVRYSLADGNRIVGSNCFATSLYARYKIKYINVKYSKIANYCKIY